MMKRFLTSKEAANYLGLNEQELQELVDKGNIPSYKIGGIYTRLKVDDLNYYRRKIPRNARVKKEDGGLLDNIRDFIYFNDFYILSMIAIIVIIYFLFR